MSPQALLQLAREAMENAYVPYSRFPVGAALLDEHGNVYVGCNIENASYGLTMCAERVAIGTAIAAGSGKIVSCAVVAAKATPCTPCGACRQVLAEFNPEMELILDRAGDPWVLTVAELLPHGFSSICLEQA